MLEMDEWMLVSDQIPPLIALLGLTWLLRSDH